MTVTDRRVILAGLGTVTGEIGAHESSQVYQRTHLTGFLLSELAGAAQGRASGIGIANSLMLIRQSLGGEGDEKGERM